MKLNIQRFAVTKTTTFEETNLNPNTNTSTLKITIYFSANNSVTYFSGKTLECTCNNITKSASVSHPKGGSVTKTFTFDNIQHEADGSKTVSWNWKCKTGTEVLGTQSASGTRALTTLHTPPEVSAYTIEEVNPQLVSAGVSDDIFVLGLSQKEVNVSYTLYDDATLSEVGVSDGTNYVPVYDENDLPIIYDLSQFNMALSEDLNGVLKAGIYIFIQDSMGGARIWSNNFEQQLSIKDYYDYIPYTKVSITESTTNAKRLGQTSGRVGLNINGVFYNGEVGNVNQSSTYKPTIKYKYWKVGDTEPLTYTNIIPASDITITDNAFSVSNYDIGSTQDEPPAPNYFDPQFAYRIKVQVNDNFTTTESNELQIQVGEAIWTEYKDRVDFKKLSIGGDLLELKDISSEIDFTGGTSYVNSQFRKFGNIIFISYQSNAKVHSANELLFTLPEEYKPTEQLFALCTLNANAFGTVSISALTGACTLASLSSTPSGQTRVYFQMMYFIK